MSTIFTMILGAPQNSITNPGCELSPRALRESGLNGAINVQDLGDLDVRITDHSRDPQTGLAGYPELLTGSETIRAQVRELLQADEKPLVVGGCCSILVGCAAAAQDLYGDRVGLVFLDGHIDFYDGRTSPAGETADCDLAIVCGHGARGLTHLTGTAPLISADRIVAIGSRDQEEWEEMEVAKFQDFTRGLVLVTAAEAEETGLPQTARSAITYFAERNIPFWVHLDIDILDEQVMPAVDYLLPDGLDWDDLAELVTPIVQAPGFLGMDLTIYNPRLDPERVFSTQIVDFLRDVSRKLT